MLILSYSQDWRNWSNRHTLENRHTTNYWSGRCYCQVHTPCLHVGGPHCMTFLLHGALECWNQTSVMIRLIYTSTMHANLILLDLEWRINKNRSGAFLQLWIFTLGSSQCLMKPSPHWVCTGKLAYFCHGSPAHQMILQTDFQIKTGS